MNNGKKHNNWDKESLFTEISRVSFVLDELRLYLDTHLNCQEAIEMYSKYQNIRKELIAEYTRLYGSLEAYFVNTENGWGWAIEPMPWEEEG